MMMKKKRGQEDKPSLHLCLSLRENVREEGWRVDDMPMWVLSVLPFPASSLPARPRGQKLNRALALSTSSASHPVSFYSAPPYFTRIFGIAHMILTRQFSRSYFGTFFDLIIISLRLDVESHS